MSTNITSYIPPILIVLAVVSSVYQYVRDKKKVQAITEACNQPNPVINCYASVQSSGKLAINSKAVLTLQGSTATIDFVNKGRQEVINLKQASVRQGGAINWARIQIRTAETLIEVQPYSFQYMWFYTGYRLFGMENVLSIRNAITGALVKHGATLSADSVK